MIPLSSVAQPQEFYQLTLLCSRARPLNHLHKIYHLPNKKSKYHNLVSGKIVTLPIITTPLTITPLIPTYSMPSHLAVCLAWTALVVLVRELRFSHGYLRLIPRYGTIILENTESNMWETGSWEQRNIGTGSMGFAVENLIIQPCIAMEIRGSARPTLRKKPYSPWSKDVAKKQWC